MRENIHINLENVEGIVEQAAGNITETQEDVAQIYGSLISGFADSAGDEADALRDQLETEKALVSALSDTLKQFAESIRFAASEFANLDSTGASHMDKK